MAKLEQRPMVSCEATLRLTEGEMRFLDAMVGYSWDSFIMAFKGQLGKYYVEGYEKDGEQFFATLRRETPPILRRIDEARKAFDKVES